MRHSAAFLCAAFLAGFASAQADDTLETLLHVHRCRLDAELEAVYKRPANVNDRFLRITVREHPQRFVQCMFADRGTYCEASASYGGTLSHEAPLPAQSVAALQRLGFAAAADGWEFQYRRAFKGEPDVDAVAVLMLTALHDAYGVRADTALDTDAPFAGDMAVACRY